MTHASVEERVGYARELALARPCEASSGRIVAVFHADHNLFNVLILVYGVGKHTDWTNARFT